MENKIGKYFKYAIGEIVLVVIGILIALQINTWTKESANKNLKITHLVNLKTDLIIQKELINEQIYFEQSIMSKVDSMLALTNSKFVNVTFTKKLTELTARRTFKGNKATFNNMIATGDITLLSETDIQQAIIRYYQRLDYTESVTNNNNLFMTDNNFGAFVSNNSLGFEIDETGQFVTDIAISNQDRYLLMKQLNYRYSASESIKDLSERLLVLTDELIQNIDKDLK